MNHFELCAENSLPVFLFLHAEKCSKLFISRFISFGIVGGAAICKLLSCSCSPDLVCANAVRLEC